MSQHEQVGLLFWILAMAAFVMAMWVGQGALAGLVLAGVLLTATAIAYCMSEDEE